MKFILIAVMLSVVLSLSAFNFAFAGVGESDDRDCLLIGEACLTPDMYKEESPNIIVDSHIQGSDTIKLFGQVNNKMHPIVVQVFAPNGNLITIDQVMSGSDGSFASTIKAGGPLWQQDGAYSVVVQQNIRNSASYVPPTAESYIATNDPRINTHAGFAETEQSVQSATVDRVSSMMVQNRETITISVVDGQIQDFFHHYFDNLWWSVQGGGYVAEISPNVDSHSIVIDLIPADIGGPTAATVSGEFASDRDTISLSSDRDTVGYFEISLPREVIDSRICYDTQWIRDFDDPASCREWGPDSNFIVLVDGEEAEFQEWPTAAQRKLEIPFTHGVTQIEIIGTQVIPEFGTIAILVLAVAIISIIAVSTKTRLNITPKF